MSEHARTSSALAGAARDCPLADKVAWLERRLGPGDEAIETHFAWVFLRGDRALKLRKPVRRDPMDYRTLAARRLGCESEVRLNRRLAPDVYLGVRSLTRDANGEFAIDGAGEVVDWLVEMRRLDRSRMLDAMLAAGRATPDDLRRVSRLLAEFYRGAEPAVRDGATLAARLQTQVQANHAVLGQLEPASAGALLDGQAGFIGTHRDWLAARAASGCIVEAHGDLRPEHILLTATPAVIDCLEFDRNLRILDRAEELEFLALESVRIGQAEAGDVIARECRALLGDDSPPPLQQFYRSHRAATRAKLYVWRADEPENGDTAHWLATARAYLELALAAVGRAAV